MHSPTIALTGEGSFVAARYRSSVTTDLAELRQINDELVEAWDEWGAPTTLSQPKARRGKSVTSRDLARMECVIGLARHVRETAPAIRLLTESQQANASIPLVRMVYECALTSVWLVQSEGDEGIKAFVDEHVRQRANLQSSLVRAVSETFREGAEDISDADRSLLLGSTDSTRRFDVICDDLEPGGPDAYVYYRVLSSLSHASVSITDLYFALPEKGSAVPPPRVVPSQPFDEAFLLFLVNASMVWSGRAATYVSRNTSHRSVLRRVAHQLGITSEIALSESYRKRHAASRRNKSE